MSRFRLLSFSICVGDRYPSQSCNPSLALSADFYQLRFIVCPCAFSMLDINIFIKGISLNIHRQLWLWPEVHTGTATLEWIVIYTDKFARNVRKHGFIHFCVHAIFWHKYCAYSLVNVAPRFASDMISLVCTSVLPPHPVAFRFTYLRWRCLNQKRGFYPYYLLISHIIFLFFCSQEFLLSPKTVESQVYH